MYLFVVLFPVAAALLLTWFVEIDHPAAANPIQVTVTGDPGSPSRAFYTAVESLSAERSVAVARFSAEVDDPSRRVLHLSASSVSGFEGWLSDGYPRVLFASETAVVPFSELAIQSAAGRYLIYGSVSEADQFTFLARDQGYAAEVQNVTPIEMLLFKQSLLYSVIACWILSATALVASTFSSARSYAIKRFWGNSVVSIYLRELARVGRYLWKRMLVVIFVAIAAIGMSGRWNGLSQVGGVAGPIIGLMLAASLVVHLVSLLLAYYLPDTLSAIRGHVQHLPLLSLSYSIRLPVTFLLVVTVGSVIGNLSTVRDVRDVLTGLESAGQAQRMAISELAASDAEGQTAIFVGVGNWLRDIDAQGNAVISQPALVDTSTGLSMSVVLINATYLDRHPVQLADGSLLDSDSVNPSQLTIGVPQARMADGEQAAAATVSFLNLNVEEEFVGKLATRLVALADHQTMFTYGAQEFSSISDSVTVDEPIVVLIPDLMGSSQKTVDQGSEAAGVE